jgi:integrase
MSVYSVKGRGWRYDFTLKRTRYTNAWFKTKKEALTAEAKRKEEIRRPQSPVTIQTDMDFLALVNERLDHVKAYNSESHYWDYFYNARRWISRWGNMTCKEISRDMVQKFILERSKVSACTANQDLRYLRAAFNFGKKKELIDVNPTQGIEFLPIEKKIKYVPPSQDIDKIINVADPDTQDYLWTVRETMARVSEINRLTWDDVNLKARYVVLYTRKKRGGHLTPREVPMTDKLHEVLSNRFSKRDESKPWVFWHTYKSEKNGGFVSGPYQDRKRLMWNLCEKADVKYFRYHAMRHAGASIMDNSNVPIGAIQKILGHENRTTTEIYLHSFGTTERDAISIYEIARQKSHTDSHTDKEQGVSNDS